MGLEITSIDCYGIRSNKIICCIICGGKDIKVGLICQKCKLLRILMLLQQFSYVEGFGKDFDDGIPVENHTNVLLLYGSKSDLVILINTSLTKISNFFIMY